MISAKVEAFDRDWISDVTGPAVRAEILTAAAAEVLGEVDAANRAAAGRQMLSHLTMVNGRKTEDLSRLGAEGSVQRVYDVMPIVLAQLGDLLWQHSPVRTGRYQRSHRLLADGEEIASVAPGWVLPALSPYVREFTLVSTVEYAGLLEPRDGQPGESDQEPDGAYHVLAVLGEQAFAPLVHIAFEFISYGGRDEPAIIVQPQRDI